MNQKGFANIILVIVIVILVGAVGYFAFVKKSEPIAQQSTPTPVATQTKTSVPTPKDETVNWKTYSNQTLGFSIKYPQGWRMAQCGTNCVGLGPQNKPEDIAISINILQYPMSEAKAYLPVLSINNGITEEKSVTIGDVQWNRVTVQQNESGTKFYEYLKEKSGKTIDISGDGSAIFNQILSTFKSNN